MKGFTKQNDSVVAAKPNDNMLFSSDELKQVDRSAARSKLFKIVTSVLVVAGTITCLRYALSVSQSQTDSATSPISSQSTTGNAVAVPASNDAASDILKAQQAAQQALAQGDNAKARQALANAETLGQQAKSNGQLDTSSFDATEKSILQLKQELAQQATSSNPSYQSTYSSPTISAPDPECVALQNQASQLTSVIGGLPQAIQASNANYGATAGQVASQLSTESAMYNQELQGVQAQMQQKGC